METIKILKYIDKNLKPIAKVLKVMKKDGSPKERRQVVCFRRLAILFSNLAQEIKEEDRNAKDRERSAAA